LRRGLVALVPLLAAVAASASAAGDRPAPARISADGFGAEVPGSHATEVEPSAAAWGSTIVAAFQVGRNRGGGGSAIGFATSHDGGRTWRDGLLPGLTSYSPVPGTAARASDPVVAYDAAHGRWLVASGLSLPDGGAWVVSSSADGLTWNLPATAVLAPPFTIDKDWMTCDNWPKSPFRGRCYLAYANWERSPFSGQVSVAVQTSTDGGTTWGPQVLVPVDYDVVTDTLSPELAVRPNGELVVTSNETAYRFD